MSRSSASRWRYFATWTGWGQQSWPWPPSYTGRPRASRRAAGWRRLGLAAPDIEEVDHLGTGHHGGVGDEAAMAAPPQRLGTHDRQREIGQEVVEGVAEGGGVHVVGVAGEGVVLPGRVARAPCPAAPPAELLSPLVGDAELGQVALERLPGQMRVAPRGGEAAHVDQAGDAGVAEHGGKLADRPPPVAHGVQRHLPHSPARIALATRSVPKAVRMARYKRPVAAMTAE